MFHYKAILFSVAIAALFPYVADSAIPHTDSERREICTISFDQDKVRPARVPDSAAACLDKAAKALADTPGSLLVLIGSADKSKDQNLKNGTMRMTEDETGEDLRFWDIPAYRSINVKDYLVRWKGAVASHIAARTDYSSSQQVGVFITEENANLRRVFPHTIPIFEDPCTIKPCPKPDEEDLHPQHREKIGQAAQ